MCKTLGSVPITREEEKEDAKKGLQKEGLGMGEGSGDKRKTGKDTWEIKMKKTVQINIVGKIN